MKISAQMSVVMAALFAVVCFGVAINGFTSLDAVTDPAVRADAVGFVWFWAFLGAVAVAFAAIGVWMVRTHRDDE